MLDIDVQYSEKLHELHNDLPFWPERMKIEKIEDFVTNLHDKTEYVIHIRNSKQALNHGYQPYIDMNTKLRQKAKNNVKKDFFK